MIKTMYGISPHDSVNEPFVLRRMSKGKLVVMDEYQDLACKTCRKVNEKAALSRGIQEEVVVKSKRPFLPAADDFYLVDERGKQIFSSVLPDEIDYYRIPSSTFYVASAKVWLQPEESDPAYRFLNGRCAECDRAREVYWGKLPRVPPTIVDLKRFVAINLESMQGARETWFVSKDVADELRNVSPRLTGMAIVPKEINDGQDSSHGLQCR